MAGQQHAERAGRVGGGVRPDHYLGLAIVLSPVAVILWALVREARRGREG